VETYLEGLESFFFFFSRFIIYQVRDGTMIRFWHDLWCGDQPLKEYFPELFSIAYCKEE
jgi:hypothetical protein